MKYIKTYEKEKGLKLSDFIYPHKLYLYQYKEYDEDDNYKYIIGTVDEMLGAIKITGYHIHDKDEGQKGYKFIRGNYFPDVYEANEEEIEKYEIFKNAENYNL